MNKKLKILIATPLYPPDIGGPALYAENIHAEFLKVGHGVKIVKYRLEKYLPLGVRHLLYFLKMLFFIPGKDMVLILDTFSVGLPGVAASLIYKKRTIIRVGGDFLWESYANRTNSFIFLKEFNERMPILSFKEKIIYYLTKFVLERASAVMFNTSWQKEIFKKSYGVSGIRFFTIENFYGPKRGHLEPSVKKYLWAGRDIFIKNTKTLMRAFNDAKEENFDIELEVAKNLTHDQLLEKMKSCYAVLLPSLSDVAPNFIIDAISLNKPFIMTRETGLFGKLKDIGLFVDPSSVKELKEKILFLADSNNYEAYRKKVSEFSFTHSWAEIAGEFLEIYNKIWK